MASVIVRRKLGFCRVMPFQHSGGMWNPDQEHRIPPRRGCSVLNNRTRMLLKHVVDVLDARHGPLPDAVDPFVLPPDGRPERDSVVAN